MGMGKHDYRRDIMGYSSDTIPNKVTLKQNTKSPNQNIAYLRLLSIKALNSW